MKMPWTIQTYISRHTHIHVNASCIHIMDANMIWKSLAKGEKKKAAIAHSQRERERGGGYQFENNK